MDTQQKLYGLLTLPCELIEWIAESIPADKSHSLLDFRLTCREISAQTQSVVARRYFSDRSFFISDKRSLHVLYEISEHETFAKSMRRIDFSFAVPLDSWTDYRERSYFLNENIPPLVQPRGRTERARHREYRRNQEELRKELGAFVRRESDLVYLIHILFNFKDVGNIPSISATGETFGDRGSSNPPWGYQRLYQLSGYKRCVEVTTLCDYQFTLLHTAILETGFPVRDLVLGHSDFGVTAGMFLLHSDSSPYASLRSLRLTLAYDRRIDEEDLQRPKQIPLHFVLAKFFLEARNLDELALSTEYCRAGLSGHNTAFWSLIAPPKAKEAEGPPVTFEKLRALELNGQRLPFKNLLGFVASVRPTLISLTMCEVHALDTNHLDAEQRLLEAHGGPDFKVDMNSCFDLEGP
ncbi:hypothetical protein LTR37_016868 [Vermiconidia calcicola]|uniref:Uncharacterized protein n=1 Tax=Vermiconidia calcicola TaxID=1690605 RepID=A0ACC3MN78_9PEZI|nr:hypothetical protein LTR37_016868 [Vermiconidia calcicola]